MSLADRFWWVLTMAAVVWYSTIAVYVAIRGGASDIRMMLSRLEEQLRAENTDES